MEMSDVVVVQLEHIQDVDFTKTKDSVSLFETTVSCEHCDVYREAIRWDWFCLLLGGCLLLDSISWGSSLWLRPAQRSIQQPSTRRKPHPPLLQG